MKSGGCAKWAEFGYFSMLRFHEDMLFGKLRGSEAIRPHRCSRSTLLRAESSKLFEVGTG
jgi:hypothetical protein